MPDRCLASEIVISFYYDNFTWLTGLSELIRESQIFINFRPCYQFQKIHSKNGVLPFRLPSTVNSASPVNPGTTLFSLKT
jgi:hypothetical protein